ncbi:MAG: cell division protein FtsL [Moraxella sp.]
MTHLMKKHKINQLVTEDSDFSNVKDPLGLYWLILVFCSVLILMTGISIVIQTQERHQVYHHLQELKKQHDNLLIEEQRLYIEQQTFSATSQIVKRSVDELGMFFPTKNNKQVINLESEQPSKTNEGKP